jgi:apolipoprotein N-acyltransferase
MPEAPAAPSASRILAKGLGVPLAAGALTVLGFAPFYAWLVPFATVAALLWVWRSSGSPLQAALSGYAFGLGLMLAGVSWVYVSLHYYGHMHAALAALATFLFCAFLALFYALVGWAFAKMRRRNGLDLVLLAPALLMLGEWLRGWIFTGFPWLTIGYTQVPSGPLEGFAPVVGAYGVSLLVFICAGFFARASGTSARAKAEAFAAVLMLWAIGLALGMVEWSEPSAPPIKVALLQGNVSQDLKWRDDVRAKTLADYRRLALDADARLVVFPETALPMFFDQLPRDYLAEQAMAARGRGADILLGTVERDFKGDTFRYFNSVVAFGAAPFQSYRKVHLVPFGEFIPWGFRWVTNLLQIPLGDMARGDGAQAPLEVAGTRVAVALCYEDIFGEELIGQLPAAGLLVNVSNDAWFGNSLAPEQHAQFSQMRALEASRPMLRATNTGVTAAIDHRGREIARLPAFTQGTLRVEIAPRSGTTPYVRWGNLAALALAAGALAWALAVGRRRVA